VIHQNVKDLYYVLMYPCSRILKPLYRFHFRFLNGQCKKVQIGCGPNYLNGFINIDGNFQRRTDYLLDVRAGLPFPDNSLDFLYSCHMMEHLHVNETIQLLRECRRVLTPGGYLRLTLPDFGFIASIMAGEQVSDFPRRFNSREGQAINHLFCDGQHKYAFSREVIEEMAREIGFSRVSPAGLDDEHFVNLKLSEPGGSFSVNLYK
jgi:predicted SAM-dependent methyltransferase